MHRLWQHDERIRLESPVEHWPRDATLARHRLQLAQERLRSRDVGRRTAVSGGSGAPSNQALPMLLLPLRLSSPSCPDIRLIES
jgi:hypothetical protein